MWRLWVKWRPPGVKNGRQWLEGRFLLAEILMNRSSSVSEILDIIEKLLPDPSSWQFAIEASSPQPILEWLHKEDYLYPPPEKTPKSEDVGKPTNHVKRKKVREDKQCSNCKTTKSTLWRTNPVTKLPECNACKLYEAYNKRKRPRELWKTNSRKRKRSPKA